ncbi:MAG: hypothetical protein OEV40_24425, partial [Acidimicrobiia bacterium]|nr:hypothetical protein [Acidimicrobiia bacterium]
MNQPAHPPRSATRHRRYTGPELGALLAKVREELGAEASIVEANRVRTGGVAGFFARESYELVAAGAETQHEPALRTQPVAAPPVPARTPARQPPVNRSMGVSMALLERAEAVSAHERTVLRQRAAADPYDLRDRPTSTRFGEVLEARLGDPSLADADLAPGPIDIIERDRSSMPMETEPAVTIDPEPAITVQDPQPAPTIAEPQPRPQTAEPQTAQPRSQPQPHTAAPELQPKPAHPTTEPAPQPVAQPAPSPRSTEPAPQPVAQPAPSPRSAAPVEAIVTVVGELATALDLTEHGLADDGDGRTELVVLTPSDPAAS